jgi:alpha-galactosidase
VLSFDVRSVRERHPECFAMVANRELITIAQDALGVGGRLVQQATNLSHDSPPAAVRTSNIIEQTWSRPLNDGAVAIVLFNRAEHARNMTVTWAAAGLPPRPSARRVRDVWMHNGHGGDAGVHEGGYGALVPPHAVKLLRVS